MHEYIIVHCQANEFKSWKNYLEKNKTNPLLKPPEKDFHTGQLSKAYSFVSLPLD